MDDLIKGAVSNPTAFSLSRAEHRLLLRIDNADLRLNEIGRRVGLVGDAQWERFERRKYRFSNNLRSVDEAASCGADRKAAASALRGPRRDLDVAIAAGLGLEFGDDQAAREVDRVSLTTALRFDGYLKKQAAMVERSRRLEDLPIPFWFRYDGVAGLSREVRQRLGEIQPETIGQAGRIPGVTPAAVAVIAAHVGRASPRE